MRFISTSSGFGGGGGGGFGGVGGSGKNLSSNHLTPASRQSSLDRHDTSPSAPRNGQISVWGGPGSMMFPEDLNAFKREIVSCLRAELQDLCCEMSQQSAPSHGSTGGRGGHVLRSSPVDRLPTTSHGDVTTPSDLYQTHLYTQL